MEEPRRKRRLQLEKKRHKKQVKSSAASKFMSNVCEDLLNEILIRLLDFKSAIVCSSVCKSWFSLITHKTFIKLFNGHQYEHSNYSMRFTFLFNWHNYRRKTHPFPNLSLTIPRNPPLKRSLSCLDFLPFRRRRVSEIRATCDGFLLLSLTRTETDLCVCHPLTKQCRFLPRPPKKIDLSFVISFGLVVDRPSEYCTNNNSISFKIVLIETYNSQRLRVRVFCSESKLWTKSVILFPRRVYCYRNMARVACNGVVYWLEGIDECKGIIAYDPNVETREQWRYIELPAVGFGRGRRAYGANVRIGVVRGRLRLSQMFAIKKDGYHMSLKVWELSNDEFGHAEWTQVHNVRPCFQNAAVLMGFHPDDGDVMFLGYDGFHVCRYDIGGDTLEKVGELPIDGEKYRVSLTQFFLKTLTVVHPSWWPKLISRMKEKKRNKVKAGKKKKRVKFEIA